MTATPKRGRGPGRPFVKGQSGNPAGARTGSRPRVLLALDALAQGAADAILDAMVARAKEGDVPAASLILGRIWPQRKGRPTPIDLPPVRTPADLTAATSALIAAVASGELSAEEAQAVSAVLAVHRTALETLDLETRVASLEAAKAGGA